LNRYKELLAENKLSMRVFYLVRQGNSIERSQRIIDDIGSFAKPYLTRDNDNLIPGGVKMYMDGSGGARTAWLYDDWNKNSTENDAGNKGYPTNDPEILRKQIIMFHNAGIHVSTHAIGDRAIDWVVDSYSLALKDKPTFGLRHGIIHCNIPTDHSISVMADLQKNHDAAYPEIQAPFNWWIGDYLFWKFFFIINS